MELNSVFFCAFRDLPQPALLFPEPFAQHPRRYRTIE
jgi:hypothetical protein